MRAATTGYVERYWAELLGAPPDALFDGVSVGRHRGLGDYPGVIVVARGPGCRISAPIHLHDRIAGQAQGAGPDDLLSPAWWRRALGPGYQVLGPSIHHFLDHSRQLPETGAVVTGRGLLEPLRRAVAPAEWQEGGFADEGGLIFTLTSGDGEVVAAANLTGFGAVLADVGVLTHPSHRGRGLGRLAAAAATRHSLQANGLARWRAREDNARSLAIARSLGFEPWCRQLAVKPLS